jgi:mannose-6-phosphate isomerase
MKSNALSDVMRKRSHFEVPAALAEVSATCAELKRWLLDAAYPMWWLQGADRVHGGFHERLQQSGRALDEPRRARLHPRQICAYSIADDMGCDGLAVPAAEHGLRFYLEHYPRADGFFRTLVAPDGAPVDDTVVLYDQAFALLGFAAAFDVLDENSIRVRAHDLLALLQKRLVHPLGGFQEDDSGLSHLTSNSHMHLLEAALAWIELDQDPQWRALAAQIVELALTRFRDPRDGQIREFFAHDWTPAPGIEGSIVQPGHQFEWAWLLLRWAVDANDEHAASVALSLVDQAEERGVDRERRVAVNALLADGIVHSAQARLWPQTERLKVACIAARTTGSPQYWGIAAQSAKVLLKYLQTPLHGLWYDTMDVDAKFIDQPAPASSFYHIVGAIAELERTLKRTQVQI